MTSRKQPGPAADAKPVAGTGSGSGAPDPRPALDREAEQALEKLRRIDRDLADQLERTRHERRRRRRD